MSRPWRRVACCAALLACAAVLGGCWDYIDIDRRGIVLGLGFEPGGDQGLFDVTVDIANPQSLGGGGGPGPLTGATGRQSSLLLTQRAPSVVEGLQRLQARVDRRLDLPFVQVILIQEETARQHLDSLLDFILRDASIRSSTCLMITPDSPQSLMSFSPTLGPDSSLWFLLVSENYETTGTFPRCNTIRTIHNQLTERGASLVPRVTWGPQERPVLEGAAVLANFDLVGWLDPVENEGALWWRRELGGSVLTIPCGDQGGHLIIETRQSGRRVTFTQEAGQLGVTLTLGARAAIREVGPECADTGRSAAQDPQVLKAAQRAVFERAWAALEAARRLKTDFLEIGLSMRRRHPQWFAELSKGRTHVPEVLDLPVTIEVDLTITEYGERN